MVISEVNRHNLNDVMDFDHVIQVHADGTVTEPSTIWAPEVWVQFGDSHNPIVSGMRGQAWELMDGYSGQYLYHGPIMHPSEYIGGRLADDILATPGIYALVEVRDQDADTDNGEDDSAGWAVARMYERPEVPADFPVKVLMDGEPATDRVTCGECERSWDDAVTTSSTPAPSGRCPFEYFH